MANTKVIYTVITGNYDKLSLPLFIRDDYDYICFSDIDILNHNCIWEFRKIPFKTKDPVVLSRFPKLLPHIVLPEYEYSLYIDANIKIISPVFYDVIDKDIKNNILIGQVPHPFRNCIYEELYQCWSEGLLSIWTYIKILRKLHHLNIPIKQGLYENNLILRKHNSETVIKISNNWWINFLCDSSHRDQLSLVPVYWKFHFTPDYIFDINSNARNVACLQYNSHNKLRKFKKPGKYMISFMRYIKGVERRGWI